MVNSGSLDKYKHQDLTPVIGREFEDLQVTELLSADEKLIKDLAVTISERGVVFLRDQDVTPQQMKELMERITEVAGCVSPALRPEGYLRPDICSSPNHLGFTCIL